MLSKCANPQCSSPFQYLHDGKVFEVQTGGASGTSEPIDPSAKKVPVRVEHFWLCGKCALTMTLAVNRAREVSIMPKAAVRSAAAS